MTAIDWMIVAFTLVMAGYGYLQGFIIGILSLIGFAAGALIGTRVGPLLLPSGAHSQYAPLFGLVGALLAGGVLATGFEGVGAVPAGCCAFPRSGRSTGPSARCSRRRRSRGVLDRRLDRTGVRRLAHVAPGHPAFGDPTGAERHPAAVGSDPERARAVRSAPRGSGPSADVPAPTRGVIATAGVGQRPRQRRARARDRLRARRGGQRLGRGAGRGRDQRARRGGRERHRRPGPRRPARTCRRSRSCSTRTTTSRAARARTARAGPADPPNPPVGTSVAILGYPEDGPFRARPGRLGQTSRSARRTHMATDRSRSIAALRGSYSRATRRAAGRSHGRVMAPSSPRSRAAHPPAVRGLRRPNAVVARELDRALHRDRIVGTGQCAGEPAVLTAPLASSPAMSKTLVIAEKPSVGQDLVRVLPGSFTNHKDYLEGPDHVVTWAVGHLVQLADPDEYDEKYKKWRMADLRSSRPVQARRPRRALQEADDGRHAPARPRRHRARRQCLRRGPRGRADLRLPVREGRLQEARQRLWLNSMTKQAISAAFDDLRPSSEFAPQGVLQRRFETRRRQVRRRPLFVSPAVAVGRL